jgi:hypothetical protein
MLWLIPIAAAIGAALISAGAVIGQGMLADKRTRDAENRRNVTRLKHLRAILVADLETLKSRARLIPGIVVTHKASNHELSEKTRSRCILEPPSDFRASDAMPLLPDQILAECGALLSRIAIHNEFMGRIGGAFGDDNTGTAVKESAEKIATEAHAIIVHLKGGNAPQVQ